MNGRRLLNVLSPGIVKEVHVGDMVFYQMENITYFVQGCRKLGVKTVFEYRHPQNQKLNK